LENLFLLEHRPSLVLVFLRPLRHTPRRHFPADVEATFMAGKARPLSGPVHLLTWEAIIIDGDAKRNAIEVFGKPAIIEQTSFTQRTLHEMNQPRPRPH